MQNPRNVAERAALEIFISRDLYGLSRDDWQRLTATFTFGSGQTKAELDEIIRRSLVLWSAWTGTDFRLPRVMRRRGVPRPLSCR